MGRPKTRRTSKKRKTHVEAPVEPGEITNKTFVMRRGKVGKTIQTLVDDLRRVLLPNTAINLKEKKRNKLKDFLNIAGPLGVSHFVLLSSTPSASYMRFARVPRGPTLVFKILQYTLVSDLAKLQDRPKSQTGKEFRNPPLVVLTNFPANDKHAGLMSLTFSNMFPPTNIQTLKIKRCTRIVLFNYDVASETVEFRHYAIAMTRVGVSKSIKKIKKVVPDLRDYNDISEYVLALAAASDSEMEDAAEVDIEESQKRTHAPKPTKAPPSKARSAVRLVEIGPRFTLQLAKIYDGFCEGEVLFHRTVTKTQAQVDALKVKSTGRKRLHEPDPEDAPEGEDGDEDEGEEDESEGESDDSAADADDDNSDVETASTSTSVSKPDDSDDADNDNSEEEEESVPKQPFVKVVSGMKRKRVLSSHK